MARHPSASGRPAAHRRATSNRHRVARRIDVPHPAREVVPRRHPEPASRYLDLKNPELQAAVNEGIKTEAARHNLHDLVEQEGDFLFEKGRQRGLTNYSDTNNNDRFFCQFWMFCAETGNYGSMIMLLYPESRPPPRAPPANPDRPAGKVPAMEPKAIAAFLRYKKKKTTDVLRDGNSEDSAPIVHVLRRTSIMCSGKWNANHMMNTFLSVLANVHAKHGHSEDVEYQDLCSQCVRLNSGSPNIRACRECYPTACLSRKGNPVVAPIVKATLDSLIDKNYVTKGCSSLYPSEVRSLRDALLRPGQNLPQFIASLGFYVLMLLSITQIMRSDESCNLTWDSFDRQRDSFIEDRDGVLQALALEFIGKTDPQTVLHYVNVDPQQPDFDPVRHLLLYVYLIQKLLGVPTPSGFLFMPANHLLYPSRRPEDGCFRTPVDKNEVRTTLRLLLEDVLDLSIATVKIGLHMFRKTGYAFRLWALGLMNRVATLASDAWAVLKYDARHMNDTDALNYANCAWSMTRLFLTFNNHRNRVSQTHPIRYDPSSQRANTFNESRIKGWTLNAVATDFVEQHLPNKAFNGHYHALECLFERQPSSIAYPQQRAQFIASLPAGLLEQFRQLEESRMGLTAQPDRQENTRQRAAVAVQAADANAPPPDEAVLAGGPLPMDVDHPPVAPPSAKRKFGENDLAIREQFAGQPIRDVVGLLQQVATIKSGLRPNELTNAAKRWLSAGFNPAMECIKNHHNNSPTEFADHWADTPWHNSFKSKRCCGKAGVDCGVTG